MSEQQKHLRIIKNSGKFDAGQLRVIKEGLKQGVDVSIYANPKIQAFIMTAMKNDLHDYHLSKEDVKLYADPRFDWYQIITLRKGFHLGIDMKQIAHPSVDVEEMEEFIKNAMLERGDSYPIDKDDHDDEDYDDEDYEPEVTVDDISKRLYNALRDSLFELLDENRGYLSADDIDYYQWGDEVRSRKMSAKASAELESISDEDLAVIGREILRREE